MNPILDAALDLLDAGISIAPTLPGGEKKPAMAWKLYTQQQASREQVIDWYTQHPEWGIAAISGHVSGNLIMVELEGRAAHHLATLHQQAIDTHLGPLWERITQGWFEASPTGGLHWFTRCTTAVPGNQKLARTEGRVVLAETRGEGGYTIVAPTGPQHHTLGKPWVRLAGGPQSVATITIEELEAFLGLFRTLNEEEERQATVLPTPLAPPMPPAAGRRRPGDHWAEQTPWEDILTPHGWTLHHRDQHATYWTRPGKPTHDGASATTRNDGNLYVFSSSTDFDTEIPLSKLYVYAHYHHRGDMSAAARHLAQEGYGDRLADIPIDLPTTTTPASGRPNLHIIDGTSALNPEPSLQVRHSGDLHEAANGQYLVDAYSDQIRFITDRDRWLHWNGHTWTTTGRSAAPIKQLAIQALTALPASSSEEKRFRLKSLGSNGISNTLTLAATDHRVAIRQADLDAHHGELNTPAGIVNLLTGDITPSDPAKLHTRSTLVGPNADCPTPRWSQFLQETFAGHPGLTSYVQQLAGYSATGYVTAQILPFLHGAGANGKSVLAEVIMRILADYAEPAPANFLMMTQQQHPTEIARLQGARLVVASEVPEGAKFDEVKVKQLTGGDTLTARYMHGDFFTFQPTHKLWLLGNHQPKVAAGGYSFWRRLRLLPFTNIIPENKRIGDLSDRLVNEEGPGILHWIIQGATTFLADGLLEPDEVLDATKAYEADEDHLQRFVNDRVHIGGGSLIRVPYKDMRHAYTDWCRTEGISPSAANTFTREIQGRFGVGITRSHGARYYTNCTLLADADDPEEDLRTDSWNDLGGSF